MDYELLKLLIFLSLLLPFTALFYSFMIDLFNDFSKTGTGAIILTFAACALITFIDMILFMGIIKIVVRKVL